MHRMTIEEWYQDKRQGIPMLAGKQLVGVTQEEEDGYYKVETEREEEFLLYRDAEVRIYPTGKPLLRIVMWIYQGGEPVARLLLKPLFHEPADAAEYIRETFHLNASLDFALTGANPEGDAFLGLQDVFWSGGNFHDVEM